MSNRARLGRRVGGMSLAELLVSMAIGSLLLDIAIQAFLGTGHMLQWVGAHDDVSRSTLLTLKLLERELTNSSYRTLTIGTWNTPGQPTVGMAFETEDPQNFANPSTLAAFQPTTTFVVYYYDGVDRILRRTVSATDPPDLSPAPLFGTICRLTAAQLRSVVTTPSVTDTVVARGVSAWLVQPSTFDGTSAIAGVMLDLHVSAAVDSRSQIRQEVMTTVVPRN